LGSASRRIDAQLDFRHAESTAGRRTTVVTSHGKFQRAADDIAGQRRRHRLG